MFNAKKFRLLAIVAPIVGACVISILSPVNAQVLPEAVVAVLDFQQLERDALAARNIREQVEVYRAQYAELITKEEEQLRREEQELKRQRTILSPEVFAQRRREFEDNVARLQRQVQNRTRRLERSIEASLGAVNQVLGPVIEKLSSEYGFTMVLDKRQVRYVDDRFDITSIVLKHLNEQLPKVSVPPPEGE